MPGQLQLARAIPSRPGSPVGPEQKPLALCIIRELCYITKHLAMVITLRNSMAMHWEGLSKPTGDPNRKQGKSNGKLKGKLPLAALVMEVAVTTSFMATAFRWRFSGLAREFGV